MDGAGDLNERKMFTESLVRKDEQTKKADFVEAFKERLQVEFAALKEAEAKKTMKSGIVLPKSQSTATVQNNLSIADDKLIADNVIQCPKCGKKKVAAGQLNCWSCGSKFNL